MAKFAVLITHREIVGKEPTRDDLGTVLKKYSRREVVNFFGKLNCLLATWQNEPNIERDSKLATYLLPVYQERLQAIRNGPLTRLLFSRLTLLFILKQACLVSPSEGSSVTTDAGRADMGLCCLMANDLVLNSVPSASDDMLRKIANLLPFSDYVPTDHYPMEIARTKLILEEILTLPEIKEGKDFVDISKLFEEKFGLSPQVFCELVFGCATRSLDISPEKLADPEALILRDTYFQHSTISSKLVAQFLSKVAIPETEFAAKIAESVKRPGDDLTVIQQFPIIEIVPQRFLCIDPGFLVEKSGRGFYWALFSELSNAEKTKLPGFWGKLFESYVNFIIKRCYTAGGRFIPAPRFANGDPSFDACLLEGRDLIVFEHKSSVLRADAKYAGDVEKLRSELNAKFVEGEENERKGVAQLNHNLCRFLSGELLGELDPKDISRIYPVLVCLEGSMTAPYVAQYLRDKFKEIYPRKKFLQVVTPLFTLGITDVENLLGYLDSFELARILDSYHAENKTPLTSISGSVVPLLRRAKPGKNLVKQKFEEFAQIMEKDLFGTETAPIDAAT